MSRFSTILPETRTVHRVVSVADLAVDDDPTVTLITYALGSCIGVTAYDPVARIGGMLHFMLPTAELNEEKAMAKPAMFADSGVPMLFHACYGLGARKERMIVCAAGGAEILSDSQFRIGARNRTILRRLFWKNSVLISGEDTGGAMSRTMSLNLSDGSVIVRNASMERVIWPE
ncbi:MAG: chemotaxis protein CheD [Phycisphaeraceae bacterium]|nr:chemotaxis protein CheD [Phycisphaeraceae bacterium]